MIKEKDILIRVNSELKQKLQPIGDKSKNC